MEDSISKATKRELMERESDIQQMMTEGCTKKVICDEIAKKYRISPRTVETQYYKIVDGMSELVNEGRAELRAVIMAKNELIFKRCMETNQFKTALDANNMQAKIGGLYTAEKASNAPTEINITERDYSKPLEVVNGSSQESEE